MSAFGSYFGMMKEGLVLRRAKSCLGVLFRRALLVLAGQLCSPVCSGDNLWLLQ